MPEHCLDLYTIQYDIPDLGNGRLFSVLLQNCLNCLTSKFILYFYVRIFFCLLRSCLMNVFHFCNNGLREQASKIIIVAENILWCQLRFKPRAYVRTMGQVAQHWYEWNHTHKWSGPAPMLKSVGCVIFV